MQDQLISAPPHPDPLLARSFNLSLLASNLSPSTIRVYLDALSHFRAYLSDMGMPKVPSAIHREHVESFIADQLASKKPATAATRTRALRRYFNWLLEEGEIARSPMERIKEPHVSLNPPPVLTKEQLQSLFESCAGHSFEDRRDTAILRLLLDTGMRRMEIASLKIDDFDLESSTCLVMGKGRKWRIVAFGRNSARDLDRYLRMRRYHRNASLPQLWLGRQGAMRADTILRMVKRRAAKVGVRAWTHLFRHIFVSLLLEAGAQEGDVMTLGGWSNRAMLDRYGASTRVKRALAAHRKFSPGDNI